MVSGIVKKYCCEDISDIENYDKAIADTTKVWECHHKFETMCLFPVSVKKLKEQGLYYNRPASELIFLTKSEHLKLHRVNEMEYDEWRVYVYYPFCKKQALKRGSEEK